MTVPPGPRGSQAEDVAFARFMSKVNLLSPDGCWPWLGRLDNGYGRFWLNRKSTLAHRVSWETLRGPIPQDLQIDHTCRNRACVNPDHLEPVTIAVNVLRGQGVSAANKIKTHCINGHELVAPNVYRTKRGQRACVPCMRERTRAWRQQQGK